MKQLIDSFEYTQTIEIAKSLHDSIYDKSVLFHCYWNGELSEKHYNSILSCYYFNIFKILQENPSLKENQSHKIILWIENNTPNKYNELIAKYAEIRDFSLGVEQQDTFLENIQLRYNHSLSFYSDTVRYVLLYKYGGCWFDLDCLILRTFDTVFNTYGSEICVYQWGNQNFPNGAIYISLEPKSEKMKKNIEFIIERNRGWGFCEANLTYDLPLDMLVLPTSWFDSAWIKNPYNIGADIFSEIDKIYTFDNFFTGAFCFHWHNRWEMPIHEKSIMNQLITIIKNNIKGDI
jgi:hypothetical protein